MLINDEQLSIYACNLKTKTLHVMLILQLTTACIKMKRPEIARRAIEVAEKRISKDRWPEYYDLKTGKFIGKQARLYQTWSIAGYLTAKLLLRKPEFANILTCDFQLL